MGLQSLEGGVTDELKKKSRISPIFKRAISHIFTKPATTKYPFVKPTLPPDITRQSNLRNHRLQRHRLRMQAKTSGWTSNPYVGSNCHVCQRDCPTKAIEIVEVDGKKRLQIDLNNAYSATNALKAAPEKQSKAQTSTN